MPFLIVFYFSLLFVTPKLFGYSECFVKLVEVERIADHKEKPNLQTTLEKARVACLAEAKQKSNDPKKAVKMYEKLSKQCEDAWQNKNPVAKKFCLMDAALIVQSRTYFEASIAKALSKK